MRRPAATCGSAVWAARGGRSAGRRRLRNAAVLATVSDRTTFGATELERFADCSSAWLFERIVDPKTIDAEVDPMLRGSVAHQTLFKFYSGLPKELGSDRVTPENIEQAVGFLRRCLDDALRGGVRLDLSDLQEAELDEGLWRDLEGFLRDEAQSPLDLQPRRFEVSFGSERSAPELQRGLELGDGLHLSGKIDRIDVDPFSARGIVQDYKSGKSAHSAKQIDEDLKLQIPLYMLVLRDMVGIEPLGGVYRALGGSRAQRGLLRRESTDDLPGFVKGDYLDEEAFWEIVERARVRAHDSAIRIRGGDVRHDPEGRRVPDVVRPLDDVPDRAPMNAEQEAAVAAKGEVFVSAGAGTGKTSVLVERFVRAVCDEGLDVDSVLVITYTRKAAASCARASARRSAARGRHDLARQLDGAWISTIHGFCSRLLHTHPFAVGLDPRFHELADDQAAVLRGEAFERALAAFCAGREPSGCGCSRRTRGTASAACSPGVYEKLRSAGRPLTLELGEQHGVAERLAELQRRGPVAGRRPARDREAARRAEHRPQARPESRAAARPLRSRRPRRARRRVPRRARPAAAGGPRGAGGARPRSAAGAARALRRRVRRREAARVGARLRGSAAVRA